MEWKVMRTDTSHAEIQPSQDPRDFAKMSNTTDSVWGWRSHRFDCPCGRVQVCTF